MRFYCRWKHLLTPCDFHKGLAGILKILLVLLLNLLCLHLDGIKAHARLLFLDFSFAFNIIQLHLLAVNLINHFKLDFNLVGWILDFLTERTQCVRINGSFSNQLHSFTSFPQGCCLSLPYYLSCT